MSGTATLIIIAAVMFCALGGITLLAHIYNLNSIKSKTVGDGQHGTARWATRSEIKRTYQHIPFTPALWRKQAAEGQTPTANGKPLPQGIVVGCTGNTTAMVDTGDVHVLMIGAAGVGKTAYWLYPCIEYACASGMSFLSTDTKGDVMRNYGTISQQYGYKVSVIDLRNPTRSNGNNLLHLVNKYMDLYKEHPDELVYKANLVVADKERTDKTICLAVTPSLKAYGISGRARLFEVVQRVEEINRYRRSKAPGRKLDGESYDDPELKRNPSLALSYIVAPPRMSYYMETSARIYDVYLKFIAPEDIHVYSIDEVFIDLTPYLKTYQKTPREMAEMLIKEVLTTTGITATAGIGTNMYLAKVAMDITAKKMPADENGVRIAELDEMSYRRELWTHRPLTDFWMVGRGISKKLEDNYMFTMGDVARCSQYNEAKVGTEITEGENELWL